MDRILKLEQELKLNQFNILKHTGEFDKEYRSLIIQRSNLKDMLIIEYRNELLERRKNYDYCCNQD